ncbi:sodium:solute symporter family protein [Halalkalicoccus jeotgali]|uniref:Na+/solute symporter n=1 Tax=Halalkalicoccus jeotgali (strain DSM 18796 / CECT 7217 / JCM 14584 / KCTC 4019 / B3) TaxID=795797 RepID=D8J8P3_HALJB|nr:sodium:solute symporter family protein [Halalkalicoccus jeotgali]ADJ14228.1 Na+/solute symporter [Halalkalicoccus jeotgali B3]ELY34591.1 Na+/solute symporter [Halalkalicoccus jeotgali B3]
MSLGVQLGIVVGYLCFALAIGIGAYRLTERTAEDYYLASRTLGTVVLLFTTFATLLSAFTFFAGPNTAYREGPEWILVMGVMDGILFAVLWYLVGYKQWLVGREYGYLTLGEMLGDRFGSPRLRALVAGISLFWLFPYVMLQQMGAGSALSALTDGAVPYWAGAGLITVFMIVYVVLAGMRGVAWTDTLQGAFMLVTVWAALLWVLLSVGGPAAATGDLLGVAPEFATLGGEFYTPAFVITQAVSIAFGVAMFPQVNQRFFVARSRAVLKRTFALWPLLVLALFVPAFMLGAWARGLGIDAEAGTNVLPLVLAEYTPAWFAALVIAGAVAAMMSSSDSMLLSGSSYFTRDLYRPFVNPAASERREDSLGRAGVVAFATGAFLASLLRPGTLLEVGSTAFGGFAQLAFPVLVALYWPRTTRTGITAGIVASQAFYLASVFLPFVPAAYGGWGASLVGMALGLALTVGVSWVTTPAAGEERAIYFEFAD